MLPIGAFVKGALITTQMCKMCLDVVVPKADVRLGRVMKTGVVGETT